ncbi:hypothetical protein ACGLWX_09710 [Halomonas sp. HMF6819]|uniref:hypothetical protein n=1 Tax=Halomonas sp. HMF6819 TaxID=3373085 RepID=UPI0037BDD581
MRARGHYVEPTLQPEYDPDTQAPPFRGPLEQDDNGNWHQTWVVRDLTNEERAERVESTRADKIREINDAYESQVRPLIRDYPEIEQQTWPSQDAEARAYLAWLGAAQGDAPATPVLDNILAGRNGDDGTETLEQLSRAVMENAEQFTQAQQLTGKRQRLVKQARAAESAEALDAIVW